MQPNLVIIGDLAYERTVSQFGEYTNIGGSAFYAAIGAKASNNENFVVITSVGDDFCYSLFDELGISRNGITCVPNQKTAKFVTTFVENSTERLFSAEWGAIEYPNFETILDYLNATIIYLAGSDPCRQLCWINLLHKVGYTGTIACDVFEKYCVERYSESTQVVEKSDIIFMNEYEKELLCFDPTGYAKMSIVKLGSHGAYFVTRNGIKKVITPQIICNASNTNGAGDILAASYLSRIIAGCSEEEALQYAVDIATLSVSKAGVTHILPGRDKNEA